ncbi:tyrosine phosphatase family protein [Aspergillus lucknowensis]|uniref:diphosphoinositol-polyphosphate diphosphatase n=1 Tax=Aspergillus lucknowensis TaxID=176173 RepID=A0ABR4LWZ2_9EURO
MSHPLVNMNSNGTSESHQDEKPPITVSRLNSMESGNGESKLPENFGEVVQGIYRSSFPQPCNLPALKSLGLRTIITLVEEPYTQVHADFLKEGGITHHRIAFIANKDPAVRTPEPVVNHVMEILLNKANHPILIHCNKGKHRTGCVSACFRKLQGWELRDIIDEYVHYSGKKQRQLDKVFIEAFDPSKLAQLVQSTGAKLWRPEGIHTNIEVETDEELSSRLHGLPCNSIRVT